MTAQKDGIRFENELTNAVDRNTNRTVRVVQGGGSSGNIATDQPDILFVRETGGTVVVTAAELKRTKRDRLYIDSEELQQLKAFCSTFIRPCLIIKFTHRQVVAVEIPSGPYHHNIAQDLADAFPDAFEASVTNTGNLSIKKPDTALWPSASKGASDHEVVIEELGL